MKVLVLGIGLLVAHGLSADVFNFAYDWEDGQYSVGYTHPRTPAHLPPGEGGSGYYGPGFHLTAVDNVSSGVEALWGDVSSNTVTPASGSQMLTFTAYSETGGGSPGTVYLSGLTGLNAGDSVNVRSQHGIRRSMMPPICGWLVMLTRAPPMFPVTRTSSRGLPYRVGRPSVQST